MNVDDLYYYWNSKSYHRLDEIGCFAFLLQQIKPTELTEEQYYKREQMLREITNILESEIS